MICTKIMSCTIYFYLPEHSISACSAQISARREYTFAKMCLCKWYACCAWNMPSTYHSIVSAQAEHRCLQGECTVWALVLQLSVYHHAQCIKLKGKTTDKPNIQSREISKNAANKQTKVFQQWYTSATVFAAMILPCAVYWRAHSTDTQTYKQKTRETNNQFLSHYKLFVSIWLWLTNISDKPVALVQVVFSCPGSSIPDLGQSLTDWVPL